MENLENNDNSLEDYFFEIILKNNVINSELIGLYDLLNIIGGKNLCDKIFGEGFYKEKKEILQILSTIRENKDIYIKSDIYKLIFLFIEKTLNIKDTDFMKIILNNIKDDIETEIIYILSDIIKDYKNYIRNSFGNIFTKFTYKFFDNGIINMNVENIDMLNKFLYNLCRKNNYESKLKEVLNSHKKIIANYDEKITNIQNKLLTKLDKNEKINKL